MMLGPGVMYWFETSLTFAAGHRHHGPGRLAAGAAVAVLPAPAGQPGRHLLRPHASTTASRRIQAMFSDISSRVQENLSGVRMIRAFAQEEAELRRFEELNRQYIAQNLKLVRIQGVFQPLLEALIGLHLPGGAVGRRPAGAARPDLARQLRHVQHLHGHAGLAHDRAGLGGEPDAARQRVARAHQRDPARAALDRRAARSRAARRSAGRDRVPRRHGGLRQRPRAGRRRPARSRPAPRSPWSATPVRARARWWAWCRG